MIGENCFNVIKALVVRGALSLHTFLTVWRVTENLHDQKYWLLCLLMLPFIAETLYSIIRRKGREYLWFSPCFFLYLCATLPPIWLLELDKSRQVREEADRNATLVTLSEVTTSATFNVSTTDDVTAALVPLDINPTMWTIVIEEMLLYLLVIGRWILPRGEVTREQLSELLFAFIGIAADVMEFFSLFGEDAVRMDEVLGYLLLSIWSLSILQFTMAVTVTQQPKRAKKFKVIEKPSTKEDERRKMRNELLAIFVSMAMQDLPFLILRLYTIVTYDLVTYSLIFFTSKNALVISLLIYKVVVILQKNYCPTLEQQEEGRDDEEIIVGRHGDGESRRSINSKYGLDYEIVKGNKANYDGNLMQRRNAPKLDTQPQRSEGSGSSGTSSPPSTTRPQPNGQSMRQEKAPETRPTTLNPPIASPEPSPTSPSSQSNSHYSTSTTSESSSSSDSTSKKSDSFSHKTPSPSDMPTKEEGSPQVEPSNSHKDGYSPHTEQLNSPTGDASPHTELSISPKEENSHQIKASSSPKDVDDSHHAERSNSHNNEGSPHKELSNSPKEGNSPQIKPSSSPKDVDNSHHTELSNSRNHEASPNEELRISPKEENSSRRSDPIIYTTEPQSAKPGDPDFKPYISVLKI